MATVTITTDSYIPFISFASVKAGDRITITDPSKSGNKYDVMEGTVIDTDGEGTVSLAIEGAQGIVDLEGHIVEMGHTVRIN